MKKKEYITPTCVIVNIGISHMLASSITGVERWGDLWEDKWE